MRWLVLMVAAACGGESSPTIASSGPPAAMIATAEPGDAIVATVGGRPVFGSCIAMQIEVSPKKPREIALRECIDFELMAQEAERRGHDRHAETIDTTRTALVSRLVDQFAARTTQDALKERIDALYRPSLFTRPEHRASWHALVRVPDNNPSDADYAAAKAVAQTIYEALQHETGLLPAHFEAAVRRVAADSKSSVVIEAYRPIPADHGGTVAEYRGGLFAIPEVGRVSSPVKTQFGYHVILLADLAPAVALDREAARPLIHANLQRRMFDEFLGEVIAKSNIKAQPFPERLEQLEKGDHP